MYNAGRNFVCISFIGEHVNNQPNRLWNIKMMKYHYNFPEPSFQKNVFLVK